MMGKLKDLNSFVSISEVSALSIDDFFTRTVKQSGNRFGLKSKYSQIIAGIASDLRQKMDEFIKAAFQIDKNLPEAFPSEEWQASGTNNLVEKF